MTKLALTNTHIFDGEKKHQNKALLINDDKLIGLVESTNIPSDYTIQDLHGGLLTSGFIDLQVNGGGGVLFNSSPDKTSLKIITDAHLKFGTTSIMPTVISDTPNAVKHCVEAVRDAIDNNASILGIHIEGPFFNPNRRGVHKPDYIRKPKNDDIAYLTSISSFSVMLTLAPEQVTTKQIKTLSDAGIKVLAGHTNADYDTLSKAINNGLSGFTHLYNAMGAATAREPSVMGAALALDQAIASIIVDGHHVHPEMVKLAYRCKPQGKLIFVSDSMASIDGDPEFQLYDKLIHAKNGRVVNDEGTLAGSAITLIDAIKIAVNEISIPLEEALKMASLYPANYLGNGHKVGQIKAGYIADLVHLSKDFEVLNVWKSGILI